ncbi:MAG: HPr(Ser) kinase/phosphatase [Calditrichaeota bacterium]|nr:HPr(Ser) kinase/phosphatase [Calditrichota bacterium]
MLRRTLTVGTLYSDNQKKLKLQLLGSQAGFGRTITAPQLHRPGLALSGFLDLFTHDRIQILGNTEIQYLGSLSAGERQESLRKVLNYELPCIIITDNNRAPKELVPLADKRKICVFRSKYPTMEFFHYLQDYLNNEFAPRTTVHGTLVDVYGIGVLFTGRSGIGKSEIALDLIERGHRLVADDVVIITKKAEEILMGEGRELAEHHLEIRGLGLIDTRSTFGIRAVRVHKRIEVEVQLVDFDPKSDYDRTGLDEHHTTILDVKIPLVVLPINPGKNITVIAETIALNQLLKIYGHHTPEEFNKKLIKKMKQQEQKHLHDLKMRDFLDKDFE